MWTSTMLQGLKTEKRQGQMEWIRNYGSEKMENKEPKQLFNDTWNKGITL
jgi:hypothetical protein